MGSRTVALGMPTRTDQSINNRWISCFFKANGWVIKYCWVLNNCTFNYYMLLRFCFFFKVCFRVRWVPTKKKKWEYVSNSRLVWNYITLHFVVYLDRLYYFSLTNIFSWLKITFYRHVNNCSNYLVSFENIIKILATTNKNKVKIAQFHIIYLSYLKVHKNNDKNYKHYCERIIIVQLERPCRDSCARATAQMKN